MSGERVPAQLHGIVSADLDPVRPLRPPWVRLAALMPVVVAVLTLGNRRWGVRNDAAALGPVVLWGLSLLLVAVGVLAIGVALREAVPGLAFDRRARRRFALGTAATLALVVVVSWSVGEQRVPAGGEFFYWSYCLRWPYLLSLPLLVPALTLAWRAWPLRPARVGVLCGLGAGLIVEGLWRTFCEVSHPGHVLGSHLVAVAGSLLTGLALALALARFRDASSAQP